MTKFSNGLNYKWDRNRLGKSGNHNSNRRDLIASNQGEYEKTQLPSKSELLVDKILLLFVTDISLRFS